MRKISAGLALLFGSLFALLTLLAFSLGDRGRATIILGAFSLALLASGVVALRRGPILYLRLVWAALFAALTYAVLFAELDLSLMKGGLFIVPMWLLFAFAFIISLLARR